MSVEVKKEIQRNLFCLKQLSFRQCATRRRQGQQRAIEEMETAQRLDPGEPSVLPFLGYGYAVTGRRAEALKILQSLDEMEKRRYVSRIYRAYIYAGLGDKDKAFEWLEKAYQERSDSLAWFREDPESKSLQADPRFAVLMRKIGFTEL